MTRKEAIFTIEHRYGIMDYGETEQLAEALDMAIDALKTEPCEDAVKREAVLNTLDAMNTVLDENRTVDGYKELLTECYKTLPLVTPKQRTGSGL